MLLFFFLKSFLCGIQSFSGLCTETGGRTTPLGLVQHLPGTIDRCDTEMKHGARSLMRAALCLFSGDSDMARRQTTRTNGASMTGSLLASYAGGNQLLAVYQVAASDQPRNVKFLRIGPTFLSRASPPLRSDAPLKRPAQSKPRGRGQCSTRSATSSSPRTSPSWPKGTLVRHTRLPHWHSTTWHSAV
ncbi:hypothetical protein CI102_9695 [Trichoderma harzianum]|nr:hypothetical protein CI102_9695 [Trichoderma harzianum]